MLPAPARTVRASVLTAVKRPPTRRSIRIRSVALAVAIQRIVAPCVAEKLRALNSTRAQPGPDPPSPLGPPAPAHADGTPRPATIGGVASPPGGIHVKLEIRMLRCACGRASP